MSSDLFSGDKKSDVSDFLCGVVEGFYGRPWTFPQRRELFRRMQTMGMNAYLYAPKDDLKHRLSWRVPYTEKEEENMRSLITAAAEHEVLFIFAISPGSDVVYSDEADVNALKERLNQVAELGCKAFALLFDDIDSVLCRQDDAAYGVPARAQAALTNKIYNALECPDTFLFCPTEYCASRAVPSVLKSRYLSVLGSDLAQGIHVLWTGPQVVSKRIPTLGIRDLSRLLNRPIVLWDNLHANDYDQRRVFLGPYAGRPLSLRRRKLLRGVLTNPNCEFEANYIAMHTLAQWSRLAHPMYADMVSMSSDLADVGDDLERERDEASGRTKGLSSFSKKELTKKSIGSETSTEDGPPVYRPREALLNALRDWLSLMLQDQRSAKPTQPDVVASPTPMDLDAANEDQDNPMQVEQASCAAASNGANCGEAKSANCDVNMVSAEATDVVPSLGISLADLELLSDLFYLPFCHGPTATNILQIGHWLRENSHLAPLNGIPDYEANSWCQRFAEFFKIVADVSQLREKLQRLPHAGVVFDLAPYLTDINSFLAMALDYLRWLESGVMAHRNQSHLKRLLTWISPGYREMTMSGDHEPWMFRGGIITEIQRILPLESAQDLFPAPSRVGPTLTTLPAGPSAEHPTTEPSATEALPLALKKLGFQPRRPYLLRPYRPEDKVKVYALQRRLLLARLGLPNDALPAKYHDLAGDRYCLAYLERFPQHCMVVEGPPLFFEPPTASDTPDNTKSAPTDSDESWDIVGFALAAPEIGALTRVREEICIDQLRKKYPRQEAEEAEPVFMPPKASLGGGSVSLTLDEFIRITIGWIHNEEGVPKTTSTIATAAVTEAAPPEPLGAALVEPKQHPQEKMAAEEKIKVASGLEKDKTTEEGEEDRRSDKNMEDEVEEKLPLKGNVEAVHSALMAHPASILVEMDDCCFNTAASSASAMPPVALMNHHLGLGFDPPELVLEEVARRLFVCLLAGLKTCASLGVHVELDTINEPRADLYRRFGFYPVVAASTNFVTVFARLI